MKMKKYIVPKMEVLEVSIEGGIAIGSGPNSLIIGGVGNEPEVTDWNEKSDSQDYYFD